MKRKRWLLQIFFLSIGLNICLFGLLFFFTLKEQFSFSNLDFSFVPSSNIPPLSEEDPLITTYRNYSFEHLIEALRNKNMLTKELSVRDLALALLVDDHYFDIEGALCSSYLERKKCPSMVTFYSNLSDTDFSRLYLYAKRERYPYSTQGVFLHLQQAYDPALSAVFMRTEQFNIIRTLFSYTELPVDNSLLLQLLLEGEWEQIKDLYEEQRAKFSLSEIKRIQFLSNYLEKGSSIAAYFLLVMDYEFVMEKFDDHKLVLMMELIEKKTAVTIKFIETLAFGTRSEKVVQRAQMKLEEFGMARELIAGRFIERPALGELRPVFREPVPKSPAPNIYIVEPGDSLWLIAKRHNISLEKLKEINRLQSDVVRPGQILRLL